MAAIAHLIALLLMLPAGHAQHYIDPSLPQANDTGVWICTHKPFAAYDVCTLVFLRHR